MDKRFNMGIIDIIDIMAIMAVIGIMATMDIISLYLSFALTRGDALCVFRLHPHLERRTVCVFHPHPHATHCVDIP
jgi:hypothetical protein